MSERRPTRWLVDVKDLLEKEFYLCAPFSQRPKVVSVFDIVTAPPVDAVEVVRCKDCKHNPGLKTWEKGKVWCRKWRNNVRPTDFCSYGKRRTDHA